MRVRVICREDSSCRSSTDSGSNSEGSESEDGPTLHPKDKEGLDKEAEKEARKQHKREVKDANKERRKHKMPKHVKKKQTSKGKKKR